ncbi:MAG TPA: hypothetical protein PL157_19945 [Acidobacteriota bacterium]|nr:hypothetical protein [Acidobacteriota bacterium]
MYDQYANPINSGKVIGHKGKNNARMIRITVLNFTVPDREGGVIVNGDCTSNADCSLTNGVLH